MCTIYRGRLTLLRVDWSTPTTLGWHGRVVAEMRVGGMRRNERLRLGRDGSEDALLLEALAIGATTVLGCFEARAANLGLARQPTRLSCHCDRPLTLRLLQ